MALNEAQTCLDYIEPAIKDSSWGQNQNGSKILAQYQINKGRIQVGGERAPALIADYVLEYKGQKLAVIEAKKWDLHVTEGLAQAKNYATKMSVRFAFSTNGQEIYLADLKTGEEGLVEQYPTPDELWEMTFAETNEWRNKFAAIPHENNGGAWQPRYYQQVAANRVLEAIAHGDKRILLTLATGTGKTAIAFQIAWTLFQSRWNLGGQPTRRPRILFLADRNILADQAYNAFGAFPEDAMVRMRPSDVKKKGAVPKNGSIFFTIFQSFMTETTGEANYGQYPPDFFDFIVIDECHRGGANDESNWRAILDYFEPAVQLGLTATPKRDTNVDTYEYFGEPVYIYSLKEGINDGFLTPFRVREFYTTLDEYVYTPDDVILEGEIEPGKKYTQSDFNRTIFIKAREELRVKLFMDEIGTKDKTLVFCANQKHALIIRDLINQYVNPTHSDFCVRVTADDGELGEKYLRAFQDNDKSVPTILTTSQKLSTGVDALNIRNIVLLRPIDSMIEFKQIIGRGTRLFEGKWYFTISDFVGASAHFSDPEWDGDPIDPEPKEPRGGPISDPEPKPDPDPDPRRREKIVIKLRDGKERAIQHMVKTTFMGPDGVPISAEQFISQLFDTLSLPEFFSSEEELRTIWSNPITRRALLGKLAEAGFGEGDLKEIQKLIDAENSDLFDVLEYVAFVKPTVSRAERVLATRPELNRALTSNQVEFINFVLERYVATGVEELDDERLPDLIKLKYEALQDGVEALGGVDEARKAFIGFQKFLYKTG
ncbi:DEAD/DEAH box helicase family protein [bacterium]|nr:DEAD/DEAH box helicase family protein [bacterium]